MRRINTGRVVRGDSTQRLCINGQDNKKSSMSRHICPLKQVKLTELHRRLFSAKLAGGSKARHQHVDLEANETQSFNRAPALGLALGLGWSLPTLALGEPLPSGKATPRKQAIVEFVGRVTKADPDFVGAERIAAFDNEGRLNLQRLLSAVDGRGRAATNIPVTPIRIWPPTTGSRKRGSGSAAGDRLADSSSR